LGLQKRKTDARPLKRGRAAEIEAAPKKRERKEGTHNYDGVGLGKGGILRMGLIIAQGKEEKRRLRVQPAYFFRRLVAGAKKKKPGQRAGRCGRRFEKKKKRGDPLVLCGASRSAGLRKKGGRKGGPRWPSALVGSSVRGKKKEKRCCGRLTCWCRGERKAPPTNR